MLVNLVYRFINHHHHHADNCETTKSVSTTMTAVLHSSLCWVSIDVFLNFTFLFMPYGTFEPETGTSCLPVS